MTAILLAALTAYSMVTHDGRRLVSRLDGTNVVYDLVATNCLPANLPPVREWTIYCIKSTHTDIGLHNPQYEQRAGSVARVDRAAELVDADPRSDGDPAAYRYVMEGHWFWHNYPADRGEAAARRIVEDYVKRGRMGIGATCAGNHTHLYGEEELARAIYTRKALKEMWGVDSRTMVMADNPGISWSVVQPYAEAGLENVVFLPNQWNPLPSTIWPRDPSIPAGTWNPDAGGGGNRIDVRWDSDFPMLFRWRAPDQESELLVWCSPHYGHGGDAFGFDSNTESTKGMERMLPAQLAKMERKYPYDVWLLSQYGDDEPPNARLARLFAKWNAKWAWPKFRTVGNLDEPFTRIREKWLDRVPVARGEITSGWLQHAASTPELLARKFAADRALTAAEAEAAVAAATTGADYPAEAFRRAWRGLVLNDEHSYGTSGYEGRRVFETWLQHRDWIEKAEAVGKVEARSPVAPNVPTEQENRWYRLKVDAAGEIVSLWDKELGRELAAEPLNRFRYTRDNHKTWEPDPVKALGAERRTRVWLDPGRKLVHVENEFLHARDLFNTNRYYRYGYMAFPFAVPQGRYVAQLNGPVVDPVKDQTGLATDAYVAVRDWCAVENAEMGVALVQHDSSLTEFGEIRPDKTCCSFGKYAGPPTVNAYLFADWLQMHNPDGESFNPRFRYAITSYAGSWRDAHLPALARAVVNPRLAAVERRIRAEADNVRLVGLKAAEDGDGFIARFRETEGRRTTTRIVQDVLPGAAVAPVSTIEEPRGPMPAEGLAFAPFAMHAVRISNGRRVAFAAPKEAPYLYTELVTHPRATHGEEDGQLYLEWGVDPSPDFDHFELYREGVKIADVRPETHDGVTYRVNRYEDLGLKPHARYHYRIRPVYRDGRVGAFEDFSGLTRGKCARERWCGFNLLGMFCQTKMAKGDKRIFGYFPEDRFRWMREWGFNFARLPLDYRFFVEPGDWTKPVESQLKKLDEAVLFGKRYGIHVQINFHRAPGYCCNPPQEPKSLFRDAEPLAVFTNLWSVLARRYRGIPNEELSFDLVNEPAPIAFYGATPSNYAVVARAALAAIRAVDPGRFVMSDGWRWGNEPVMELHPFGPSAGESIHCYAPHALTHFRVSDPNAKGPCPPWPPKGWTNGVEWLERNYVKGWQPAIDDGTFLFVGECGAYQGTVPHATYLAWLEDLLTVCDRHGWGWALWNLDGIFGILDTPRTDCAHVDFHGHKLDRAALDILMKHNK